MKKFIIVLLFAAATLTGCASQQAGMLLMQAQQELAVYERNANAKVEQAEKARLELEMRMVKVDLENLYRNGIGSIPPEEAAQKTVDLVMKKVADYEERLSTWRKANQSATNLKLILKSLATYHAEGVGVHDLIPALEEIDFGGEVEDGAAGIK